MTNPWPGPSTDERACMLWRRSLRWWPYANTPFYVGEHGLAYNSPIMSDLAHVPEQDSAIQVACAADVVRQPPDCVAFFPVRCPAGSGFDLLSLLQNTTRVEEELLESELGAAEVSSDASDPPSSVVAAPAAHALAASGARRPPGMDYQHWLRKLKAESLYQAQGHQPRKKTLKKLVPIAMKSAEHTDIDCLELPATNGAYRARASRDDARSEVYSLEEVKTLGIRVLEWDGVLPIPLLDKEGRIFAVLAGRPTSEGYLESCNAVYELFERERQNAPFTPEQVSHRRGDYPALNVGVTHGMGTLRPTPLDNGVHAGRVERIVNDKNLQRLASFASCPACFSLWAPRTYAYYRTYLEDMFAHTGLPRLFPHSVFPAAALNFGPKVCTCKHNDCKNCPFGWCTVTPVGRFNHKAGGHLILWELGVAVEFPAGSTILFPSATIAHSNTVIADGEERASFTQYCSGGLFRWVDYGFQTEKQLKKNDPARYRQILAMRPERWRMGVELWSTLEELMDKQKEA